MYCPHCDVIDRPEYERRGTLWLEILLWCFGILPGLIYSLWRKGSSPLPVCPLCGQRGLLPSDSPRAQQLLAQ